MGRPRLGKELKKPSDYSYDFPEQRELCSHLHYGDIEFISQKTGLSKSHVWMMTKGKRKMKENVKKIIESFGACSCGRHK